MTRLLVTVCARGGSKGLPGKNLRDVRGKPLIRHTLELALEWDRQPRIVVSTDSEEIANVARSVGIEVGALRPAELATDGAPKLPVISHALRAAQQAFGETYELVVDLDPTAPLRTLADLEAGVRCQQQTGADVAVSVVRARKSPYFNMVERGIDGTIGLSKPPDRDVVARQQAPQVFEINGSIYVYDPAFLLRDPVRLWDGRVEVFEMAPETAFDIDEERDLVITEALMAKYLR